MKHDVTADITIDISPADLAAHYSESYESTGDRHECAGRLAFMHEEATRRWPMDTEPSHDR